MFFFFISVEKKSRPEPVKEPPKPKARPTNKIDSNK